MRVLNLLASLIVANCGISEIPEGIISEWDNTLPTLVYHGIAGFCAGDHVVPVIEAIQEVGKKNGKDLYAECLVVGFDGNGEKYTSIFEDLTDQARKYCDLVKKHPVFSKSDFNIVAESQGGQVSRHMIQDCDLGQFKVRNYLSVAGPQQGVSKGAKCFQGWYCNIIKYVVDNIDNFKNIQHTIAPANYWNSPDPVMYQKMLDDSIWLPYINNLKPHAKYDQYKTRFSSLNKAMFVKFQNDTIIYPPDSTQFGSIDAHDLFIPMEQTELYINDTIGLKTLNEAGKIYFYQLDNEDHLEFKKNEAIDIFVPFLYQKDWKPTQ